MRKKMKLFIAMVSVGALLGTIPVMAAEQPELPTKVQDIANGSDDLYGEGVPIEHGANPDERFSSGGVDHTHQYIVANALKILSNDQGNSAFNGELNSSILSFIYEKTNEVDLYRLIDIAAKYDIDVLFNIVSSVGRAKENSEILTDMEHLDMNLKIVKYILKQGYENKKIGGAFYQRIQVRNSCGGYGKVMAIFPEGDIYMCQCMEQNQVRMGNILSDEPQKILQELENLLKKDEIKRLFCAEHKEICKEWRI